MEDVSRLVVAKKLKIEEAIFLENGNKDFRMLPIAVSIWIGCFCGKYLSDSLGYSFKKPFKTFSNNSKYATNFTLFVCLIVFTVLLLCLIIYVVVSKSSSRTSLNPKKLKTIQSVFKVCISNSQIFVRRYNLLFLLVIYAVMLSCVVSFAYSRVESADIVRKIAYGNANNENSYSRALSNNASLYLQKNPSSKIIADLTVISPPKVSKSFRADCYANVSVSYLRFENSQSDAVHNLQAVHNIHNIHSLHNEVSSKNFAYKSYASARLYAYKPLCSSLSYGSSFRSEVTIGISKFNPDIVELSIPKNISNIVSFKNPSLYHSAFNSLWKSFYKVAENLDDQGKILVPGLTVGLLGQEYVLTDSKDSSNSNLKVDSTYADCVKDNFQHAGIMHLMAVSGGHFLLLSAFIRKVFSYFLISRRITAFFEMLACVALAGIVYPSASVLRALIMGLISALAFAIGRPYQSISALSWTVCFVLLANPSFAWDYAFALSCSATLGIIVMGIPLSNCFNMIMPKCLSSALSMTIAAQCFTLPIQILIQPEISFMATFANLMVSPFVDWATVCGLISLACSIFNSTLGLFFARSACIGTDIISRCAQFCSQCEWAVFPWLKGSLGSWLIFAVELSVFVSLSALSRLSKKCDIRSECYLSMQLVFSKARRIIDDSLKLFAS